MMKLFGYELKRLIWNKFFLGLLIISGVYGYQILRSEIIQGVASTAPFSAWSFGLYLADLLPLLLITVLFFVTFLFSRQERRVAAITAATPIDPWRYSLVRCLAMVVGFCLISLLVVAVGLVFYLRFFGFTEFGCFLVPAVITLLPALFVILGLGLCLGRLHSGLLYVLMLVLILLSRVALPPVADLFGTGIFSIYPLELWQGLQEPAFSLPTAVYLGKLAYLLLGLALCGLGLRRVVGKMQKLYCAERC